MAEKCLNCGFEFPDSPRKKRLLEQENAAHIAANSRINELEATVEELRSARKDWEHQKWLLEMGLEGYSALSEAQGFIIDELKVAGLHK